MRRPPAVRTILTCIACALLFLAGCRREAGHRPTVDDVRAEDAPVQESWDATFYVNEARRATDETRRRLTILAGYMARYEREDSTFTLMRPRQDPTDSSGTRVKAYLFDAASDTAAVVTADRMIYYDDEGRFEARGDVVVVTDEGRRLQSELLYWDEADRKVRTPGFATLATPTEEVRGYELVADEDLETFRMARITGQVLVEEEE